MGSEPAEQPPAATRRIDAAGALNVQRLLDHVARSDGFDALSDQLAADLDELVNGTDGLPTIAVEIPEQFGADADGELDGLAVATRRDGDWTMQVVTDPRRRDDDTVRRLVERLLAEISLAGGGRVDWWVYAPTEVVESIAGRVRVPRGSAVVADAPDAAG